MPTPFDRALAIMPTAFNRALHVALDNNDINTAIEWIKTNTRPALLDQIDENGFTPMQVAARYGMLEVVLWLSYAGASIDARQDTVSGLKPNYNQKTPFYLALENGYGLIAQVLLCLGADRTKHSHQSPHQKFRPMHFDPPVWANLYQWAIQHYHPPFQLKLLDLLVNSLTKNMLRIKNSSSAETTPLTQKLLANAKPNNNIPLNTWSIMLNGLIAFTNECRLTEAESLLNVYLTKIGKYPLPQAQFSATEREIYDHFKRHDQNYSYPNNVIACLNVINRLALEYDLGAIRFFLNQAQLGIDILFQHALRTKNKNLCAILMFIADHPHQNAFRLFAIEIHHFLVPLAKIPTQSANFLKLVIDTELGPSRLIRTYCDEQSLLHLLQTTHASYQFQQTLTTTSYLLRNQFMGELAATLKQQSFFSHRDWRFFKLLASIFSLLTLMFSLLPTLLQTTSTIQVLDQLMHNMTYALNTTQHCDDFSTSSVFPLNCQAITSDKWANCSDLCQQIGTLDTIFLALLIFGELIPAATLGVGLGFIYYFGYASLLFKQFFSGERRFENLHLDQVQQALKAQAEQVVQVLNQEHFKIPLDEALSQPPSITSLNLLDDITTLSDVRRNFNRTKHNYGAFFKEIRLATVVSHDVKISIEEEPESIVIQNRR